MQAVRRAYPGVVLEILPSNGNRPDSAARTCERKN